MRKNNLYFLILLAALFVFFFSPVLFPPLFAQEGIYTYDVEFDGIKDKKAQELLQSVSQLVDLKNTPAATAAALKRRAESDIPNLLKALQSLGYYEAKINVSIDYETSPVLIHFNIETGPVYTLASFKILETDSSTSSFPYSSIFPRDLNIRIGDPALPKDIIASEEKLITLLNDEGYPLSVVEKREVIADQATKTISVVLHVNSGPLSFFGPVEIVGQRDVRDLFFQTKIRWSQGDIYNPEQVDRTLKELEASGLFSSITVTHAESAQENGTLPMTIHVTEAKHRSLAFGFSYATDLGAGIHTEWEHRNIRGLGQKFSFSANLWQRKKEGSLRYIKPDFLRPHQDLIWEAVLEHEITRGFEESSFSLSGIIERQINDKMRLSYGGMYKRLFNSHSDNNRNFNLLKTPFQILWRSTDSLLDPTEGGLVHFKATPTLEVCTPQFAYSTNLLTVTAYQPLDAKKRFVLAGKATIGTIWGSSKYNIPPSERFYAGSDNLLRGYSYLTVSPLSCDFKPLGGRSMMVYSLEARMRTSGALGFVAFYDIGNVYSSPFPQFNEKQLQSTGIGLRYHTPVGPLRMDVAVPLTPRRHVDKKFQIYFSIGQAF